MVAVADDFPDMGPLRADVHHSRPVRLATPYTVADFHRLPSAGLPAHPDHPITRYRPDRNSAASRTEVCYPVPVALATAAAVLAAEDLDGDARSRVIQGVFTGVGFLGTGVILRPGQGQPGGGVPTAATIWLTASLGVLCGLRAWPILIIALGLTFFVLFVGDEIVEKWLRRRREKSALRAS